MAHFFICASLAAIYIWHFCRKNQSQVKFNEIDESDADKQKSDDLRIIFIEYIATQDLRRRYLCFYREL